MQSKVKAFGLEQPCIQDPLKTSHDSFLHLAGHNLSQRGMYLSESQPEKIKHRSSYIQLYFTGGILCGMY